MIDGVNNTNYFDIWKYISSNLEEEILKNKVLVHMDIDSNDEPYIEVIYIDEHGNQVGFNKNFENLNSRVDYIRRYSNFFEVYNDAAIISIVYDTYTKKLNLIRMKNGNYLGNKFCEDFENAIFVGYIINNDFNLTLKEKIKLLYEVMEKIMSTLYASGYESNVIFKVKNQEISNIYYNKNWYDGCIENDDIAKSQKHNMDIIEEEYHINENNVKKLK